MKNLGTIVTLFVVIAFTMSVKGAESEYKKILGVWEFIAQNAPQPYDGGILTLKEVDQKLTGSFTVQGQPLPIPKIEFANDILNMDFEVESTPISLKLQLKKGIFEGTTQTPNGLVTVTAKPSVQGAK